MKLHTLLVDDERLARQRLRRLLAHDPEVEIVGECVNGEDAVAAVRELTPDLLLLDIQMPGMDGFDVIQALGISHASAVVFVTAFDQHAVRAFEACTLDYLLKPTSPARLARSLARVREHLTLTRSPADPNSTVAPPADSNVRRFLVRSGQRTTFVSVDEIDWIEADGNYAVLHVGSQNHLLRETMGSLESQLPPQRFLRVSRSAILRLDRVKELHTASDGHHSALLLDGARVPITRSLREVEERLCGR